MDVNDASTWREPVTQLISALGGQKAVRGKRGLVEVYDMGFEVLGTLRDLKAFCIRDDGDRHVQRFFNDARLLQSHLLPILRQTAADERNTKAYKIAILALELANQHVAPLLMEDEMLELAQMVSLKGLAMDYFSLLEAQKSHKVHLLDPEILNLVLGILTTCLSVKRVERTKKDDAIIMLCLRFFRDLALVQGEESRLIHRYADCHILYTLMLVHATCDQLENRPYAILAMECLWAVFKGQSVKDLTTPPVSNLQAHLDLEKENARLSQKSANSRHGRFSSTVVVQNGDMRYISHQQKAIKGDPAALINSLEPKKTKRTAKFRKEERRVLIDAQAIKVLLSTADQYLQTCFQTFFSTLLGDLTLEKIVLDLRQETAFMAFLAFFLDLALVKMMQEPTRLADIAGFIQTSSAQFIIKLLSIASERIPINDTHLQNALAVLHSFLAILKELSKSPKYKTVSDTIQAQIYYNGPILHLPATLLNAYSNQSLGYLNTLIKTSNILLKMLEKWTAQNDITVIRKNRLKHATDDAYELSENVDHSAPKETTFDFKSYQASFATQGIIHAALSMLLQTQETVTPAEQKGAIELLHRIAVPLKAHTLFFQVSTLNCMQQLCETKDQDLKGLINYIVRQFFKAAEADPLIYITAFYPSTHRRWKDPDEMEATAKSKVRRTAAIREVAINGEFTWSEQVGIALACLTEAGQSDLIDWLQTQMRSAAMERQSIIDEIDGGFSLPEYDDNGELVIKSTEPSLEAMSKMIAYDLRGGEQEEIAMTNNAHLKLVLRLLDFTMEEFHTEATDLEAASVRYAWQIPTHITPKKLDSDCTLLEKLLAEPLDLEGQKASDRLTVLPPKRKPQKRREKSSTPEEEDDSDFIESEMRKIMQGAMGDQEGPRSKKSRKKRDKEENKTKRRKRDRDTNIDDDTQPARKEKTKEAAKKNYLSAAWIDDSDDEMDDEAFFAREAEIRAQNQGQQPRAKTKAAETTEKVLEETRTPKSSIQANKSRRGILSDDEQCITFV